MLKGLQWAQHVVEELLETWMAFWQACMNQNKSVLLTFLSTWLQQDFPSLQRLLLHMDGINMSTRGTREMATNKTLLLTDVLAVQI